MLTNRREFTIGEGLLIQLEQIEYYAEKLRHREMIYAVGFRHQPELEQIFRMKIAELNRTTAPWTTGYDVPRGRDIERLFNITVSQNDGNRCPCGFSIGYSVEKCELCLEEGINCLGTAANDTAESDTVRDIATQK